ncbi:RluA family pseudouridine synthase [Marinobacter xiaoshiensis]|uniref:RluA family pseudouridine synthase n=1 Tax=Marinobacter xiaoshiensis TaxID=3073652 RepID=A0ABU2HD38_9GAMM|nr:RluA family pseudouridine synthase [Marinobacter sp. F60267]MDS1308525.1 RluA family pseudouridine synthase [Marinobacter sp. F60267]
MRRKFDVTVKQPETASEALSEASGLPRQRIKDAMNKGACWWTLKGKKVRLRRATKELQAGTQLQLYYDENVLNRKPEAAILIEDKSRYSVWFKPHGLLAQGSQWGDHCSLLRWAEIELKRPCFLIHRLDGDAAGLMLIAHDSKAAGALSQCFSGRTMTKRYLARVAGVINTQDQLIDTPIDGKAAISHVSTLSTDDTAETSLLRVIIETGRKHQIRKHLQGIGHPIIGDRLYGKPAQVPLQLLAAGLELDCPLSRQRLTLELPKELANLAE